MAYTPNERAMAVARVLAGESRRKVAEDIGVADTTVRRWMGAAERCETSQEKTLADHAERIAGDIERRQEQVREELLERIVALIPGEENLRDAVWSYGVITDKVLLARGEPTARNENITVDERRARVKTMRDELAERRKAKAG